MRARDAEEIGRQQCVVHSWASWNTPEEDSYVLQRLRGLFRWLLPSSYSPQTHPRGIPMEGRAFQKVVEYDGISCWFKTVKQWKRTHKSLKCQKFPAARLRPPQTLHLTAHTHKQQLTSAGQASRTACVFGKLESRGCEVWTRRASHRQMQSDSFAGETLYITTKTEGEPAFFQGGVVSLYGDCLLQHQTVSPSSPDEGKLLNTAWRNLVP